MGRTTNGERDEPELVEGEGVADRTAVADEDTQSGCGSVAAADEGAPGGGPEEVQQWLTSSQTCVSRRHGR